MTMLELKTKYPNAVIDAGIGGVHYQEGDVSLTVKYNVERDGEQARQIAVDSLVTSLAKIIG